MCTVFWDVQVIIPLDFLEPGAAANSERYIKALIKVRARIARTRSEKKKTFLQHENARPHANLKTTECVTKFGWTELPDLPSSPELALPNFYLFGPVKEGLLGELLVDNNAVIDAVKNGLPQL